MKNKKGKDNRCPWHETVGRIFSILGCAVFIYAFILAGGWVIFSLMDKLLECNIREWILLAALSHPTISIILLIVGYFATLLYFSYKFSSCLLRGEQNENLEER